MAKLKVASWVAAMKTRPSRENERGNTVHSGHVDADRYMIDFAPDFKEDGWLQFDTSQDAHYFGFWVNPTQRLTLTYCEGDWSLVVCPTVESYNAEIQDACRVYGEGFIAKAISTEDGSMEVFRQDRSEFFIRDTGAAAR